MTERALTAADIPAVLALQAQIHETMARRDWLVDTTPEQFDYILRGGGYGLGLFEDEELLGVWMLYYPLGREDALGYVMGMDETRVAHYELALLDERLRGRGLHKKMVERLTEHCRADGRFTHIAATAHPENLASVRGFTGCGYEIFDVREMYGGVMRCIVYKALQNN